MAERRWLIHYEDGSQHGPVTTLELGRAVRAGILPPRQIVAPMDSPRDTRPIGAFREIERAVAELSVPENDEGEEALRTLIATPAAFQALGAGYPEMSHLGGEEGSPDSEPSTLIAPSPFEDAESIGVERVERVEPKFVVTPPVTPPLQAPELGAPRPAAGRRPSMPDDMPRDPALAATMLAPTPALTPAPIVVGARPDGRTRAGARLKNEARARHRLYLFVAFAFGLAGGLIVLTIVYLVIGR